MKNTRKGLEISELSLGEINLFVGSSGAGKTQILRFIYGLKNIAAEETAGLAGLQWKMDFSSEGKKYRWEGSFSAEQTGRGGKPLLEKESLEIDGEVLFSRKENEIVYRGMRLPKVSAEKSVLSFFPEEEDIKGVLGSLAQIHYMTDLDGARKTVPQDWVRKHRERIASEEELVNSGHPLLNRLMLAFLLGFGVADEIKEEYMNIFPQVEDIRVEDNEEKHAYQLFIREKSSGWLDQNAISAGMYKTLLFIAEMKLLKSHSVLLVDEIENSLGANCINVVADMILLNEKEMQFLITSHHPYIINNIDVKNWRIVLREGSRIYTKTAEELNLGRSRHEFFKQLLNLREFTDGIN